jgi:hypothetical protein
VDLTSDQQILWQHGFVKLNGTIATTWAMIIAMGVGSKLVTRRLATEGAISRWQGLLEIVITSIEKQIQDVGLEQPEKYISFLGTLFLFVATAALCTVIPGFKPPTGSLSTTAALALCVFVAVPLFGIGGAGAGRLSEDLYKADHHHAAVQHHQRTLAHAGAGRSSVRQHDERRDDCGHPADDYAVFVSHHDDDAGAADRYGSGLYLQHSRGGLYRSGNAGAQAPSGASKPKPAPAKKVKEDLWTTRLSSQSFQSQLPVSRSASGRCARRWARGRAVATALTSLAQQPDASATITRTLFVGLAMIESLAIYCFVVSMILIFANPFWTNAIAQAGGK